MIQLMLGKPVFILKALFQTTKFIDRLGKNEEREERCNCTWYDYIYKK